jgi:soluble lytic murein transglycosylase
MNFLRKTFLLTLLLATACASAGTPSAEPSPAPGGPTATAAIVTVLPSPPQSIFTPTPTAAPADPLAEARQYFFYGDYDNALRAWDAAFRSAATDDVRAAARTGYARTLWKQGNTAQALTVLRETVSAYPESPAIAEAWFLLAEIYQSLNRYGESVTAWQAYLNLQSGVLDDYVQERIGDALIAQGSYLDALNAYRAAQQFPAPGDRTSLEIKIAQSHALLGDYATALGLYQSIYDRTQNSLVRARVNYYMGEIYQILGQNDNAFARWQENINQYPLAYESYLSLVALLDAGQPVDNFLRAKIDYHAGQYGVGLAALDAYLASAAEKDPAAYYYCGLLLQALGRYNEAISAWQDYITRYPDHAFWVDAWEDIAYTQWAYLNRPDLAGQTLLRFAESVPAHPQAPAILFDAGRMFERSGQLSQAASAWEKLVTNYPNNEWAPEALFQQALLAWRQGNINQARQILEQALILGGDKQTQARAHLWIGKAWQQSGDAARAAEIWRQGSQIDPTGYYSERMRDLLLGRDPFETPATILLPQDMATARAEAAAWVRVKFNLPTDTDLLTPGPLADDLRLHRGIAFWQLGHYAEAYQEFESLRRDLADDPANSFRLAVFLHDLGAYRSAIFAARNVLDLAGMGDAETLSAPAYFNYIRFGLYYPELVQEAATRYNVPPLLLWSVIRQESLFDPTIRSNANAVGLMQFIPSTAEQVASQLGWPPNFTSEDMARPLVSITFGAYYLSRNYQELGNDWYAALAAYNGGPINAAAWQQIAGNDPDLLLEVIRFSETRNYIRGIYEVFNIYRQLYSPLD